MNKLSLIVVLIFFCVLFGCGDRTANDCFRIEREVNGNRDTLYCLEALGMWTEYDYVNENEKWKEIATFHDKQKADSAYDFNVTKLRKAWQAEYHKSE